MAQQTANVDQLREGIDSGHAADKVAYPDPATAPLGTDDEAAGTPVSQAQLDTASRQELRSHARRRLLGDRSIEGFPWLYLALAIPVACVILLLVFLAVQQRS